VLAATIAVIAGLAAIGMSHRDATEIGGTNSNSNVKCHAQDITISKLNDWTEFGYAHLTGIVSHRCSSAVGIELKWSTLNPDGTVAFSQTFWPASEHN
jgi:hypothetical protein